MDWTLFLNRYCKLVIDDGAGTRIFTGKVVSVDDGKLGLIDKFDLPQAFDFAIIQKCEVLENGGGSHAQR